MTDLRIPTYALLTALGGLGACAHEAELPVSAGTGPNLEDDALIVERIFRYEQRPQPRDDWLAGIAQAIQFVLRQRGQLGVFVAGLAL